MPVKHHQKFILLILVLSLMPVVSRTQIWDWSDDEREGIKINYTEANVAPYTLPDLLTLLNGQKVTDTKTWNEQRRPEIMRLLVENQFGRALGNPQDVSFSVFDKGTPVFLGKALRKQVQFILEKGLRRICFFICRQTQRNHRRCCLTSVFWPIVRL